MKNTDYQELYAKHFQEVKEQELLNLKTALNIDNGKKLEYKFNDYCIALSERLAAMTGKRDEKQNAYSVDIFIDDVVNEFQKSFKIYPSEHVRYFFLNELEKVKTKHQKFNTVSPAFNWSVKKTIHYLAEYLALKEFIQRCERISLAADENVETLMEKILSEEPLGSITQPESKKHPVYWTGGDNKTQFVQLIYGLHKAKLLNNGEGEITKIVKHLSALLNVNLGEASWQKNHSDAIHNNNKDYTPPIFEQITNAYKRYSEQQINKKNKN